MGSLKYKVLRDGALWSVGYPTKRAATAAARRLNKTSPHGGKYTVETMTRKDYAILNQLEKLEQERENASGEHGTPEEDQDGSHAEA